MDHNAHRCPKRREEKKCYVCNGNHLQYKCPGQEAKETVVAKDKYIFNVEGLSSNGLIDDYNLKIQFDGEQKEFNLYVVHDSATL